MIPRIIKAESLVGVHTHTHTHTSNLEKIINKYKEKGNIILSSNYYDTG